jgi:Aminotransferase class-V
MATPHGGGAKRLFLQVLPKALRSAAESLGAFIGADGCDIAFVENATTGCNAVLRSLRLAAGDELLMLSHGYPAVRNAVRHVAEEAGARVVEAKVPFPPPQPDAILAGVGAALTGRTRVAVIDHIFALTNTRNDIQDERVSWGRSEYVISAAAIAALAIVLFTVMQHHQLGATYHFGQFVVESDNIWLAARAGTLGGYFRSRPACENA